MSVLLEEAKNVNKNDVTKMPQYLPLSTAKNIETVSALNQRKYAPAYKTSTAERLITGAAYAVSELADAAPALELLGEEAQLGIGGYFGAKEDFIDRKKLNIATLQRNLAAQQQNRMQGITAETADSWAFGIGQGLTNFALMYVTGGVGSVGAKTILGASAKSAAKWGAAAGIASAIPLENIEQQSDRIKFDEQGNIDTSDITPEWARKTTGGVAAYLTGMGILEAKFGIFKNLTLWEKPIPFKNRLLKNLSVPVTTGLKSFVNEGSTEGLQSLLSSGIQLAEGNIKLSDMPAQIQQAWKEAIIGGLLGGTTGVAVGVNQGNNVKTWLNEEISKVVTDPEECEKVVDAIYESGTIEMTNVISKELELSSELNTKHGAIYDNMQGAIFDAINNAGAFQGVEEAELAQYVSETSKMFANQVLAEANKRGVLIDEVLKAGDIKFENGKIQLKSGGKVIAETPVVQEEVQPEALKGSIEMNVNEQGEETQTEEATQETTAETSNEYNDFNNLKDDTEKLNYIYNKFGRGSKKLALMMLADGLTAPVVGYNNMYSIRNKSITKAQYNKALKIYEFLNNARNNAYDTAFGNTAETQETTAEQNNTGSLSSQMEEAPKEENVIQDYGEKLEGAKKDKVIEKEEQNKETDIEKILKKVKASKKEEVKDFLSNLDPEYIKQIAQMNLPVQTYSRDGETELLYRDPKSKYWYKLTPETLEKYKGSLKKLTFAFSRSTDGGYYLWGKKGSGSWIPLIPFDTEEEMNKYKKEHSQEDLNAIYEEMTTYKSTEKEIRERKGEDYRKGKNITEKELAETFGFRGVQFGNYENNAKRQREINNTFDSLKDLAKVLNIPDKAISLDGSLGIAFGARGSGKAAAHYESDLKIINITRDAGAGALAHEWFHALDDYLGQANASSYDNFITKGNNYNVLRDELKEKFLQYIRGVNKEKNFNIRLRQLGAYWKRAWEKSARIFEQYVNNKIEENGGINDYLAQDRSNEKTYLTKEEQERIFPLLDAFFNELKYAETDNGYKLYQEMQELDKTGTPYNEPTININGVERPTTNSEGNAIAKTKEAIEHFYKWFGDSKVVDEEGRPLVVYHGSVNTFEIFDKGKASPEGDMGAGFYFTSNEEDADSNYHGGGPDFDNKVARRVEQIQQEREEEGEDIDYEDAKELAEKELKGEPMQFSVYLKIENPCYADGMLFTDIEDNIDINEEDFETEDEYYEERDYQLQNEIDNVLDYAEREFSGVLASYNYDEQKQNIFNIIIDAIYNGGINVTGLKQSLNELYLEDENGNMVANEVLRAIIESLGYDGIIDESVSQKFNMNIPSDTTHYIAFNPTQIKSVDNQGTFDENNPNIYHQLKNNPKEPKKYRGAYDVSAKAIELFKDADYSTLPHELAHFWLDNMWQFSRSGKASEAYMNNFNGVLDWLGVKDGQINLTRAQQEKFARGYEKYLYNGYAPSGLVQGAFDDYDRWLQKVYKDAKELRVKLNADAIEFFDTMTTGELPEYDVPETQAEIREKNIEQINKDIETARKFVVEKQEQYNNYDGGNVITENTVPVTTEGEKKQSRAYTNQAAILGIAEELDYNRANIEEQNRLATEFVKNNLDEARQVVNGQKEAPSNILKNAIYNAYLKEMLAIGDNEAYINALRNQSLELTRAGQEIASQRGAIENIFDSGYWIRRIENLKKSKLASEKFGSGWTASEQEQALSRMNNYIKNKVDAVMEDFMAATPEEQKKIAEKLSKEIAAEFKQKPDTTLYQSMREPSELRTRTNAYNYLYRYINGALGLELTRAQSNEIIAKTQAIQKSIETTRNRNGNPSALFFKNISEMETYANSIEPSPALAILTSTVGRGNMLFSPKTIALNIESNIVNFFTEAITRRLQTGAVEMSVDPQVIKDYLAYSREVFNTSGYQVSSMPTLDPTTQILSEKMTTTGGNRLVDKVGRFFEQSIFKYGLGAPDLFFKDMTFVDTANLLATKEANGDSKKATELFKDICLVEPKTAKGKELREIAINEALVATYQNQGKTSDLALGIRNAINKATGSLRAGDLLSPFVKTPANVIGLGFDYSMGGLVALKNIQTIYNDIQNGTFTDTTRKSLRSLARNGIGFFAAMLIAGMLDDDDYIPEYALLSPKERELVKLRGGVFNSIKIGNKYISLDYFGPLAMPLVSYLNTRRADNSKDAIWNYFQGSAYQALKLPVVGDIKSLLEGTGRTLTQDADSNIKMAEDAMIDFVASRSIPAIVTDIAKMTDEFERETNNDAMNRLISKLPVLREELPMQYNYGTGRARETQNPINVLLAGARVKDEVTSPVIRELNRLDKTNAEEKVNLAKVTKSGKLSELSDTQKIDVERKFAQRYATEVNNLIQSNYYPTLDNSGKAKAINKIRDKVRDDIKIEYGLKQPPKPKRRYRRKR